MKLLRKILVINLIFIILAFSFPIENIIESMVSAASSIKTVDLTSITTGTDAEHTHVYERKYDGNVHWEECFICHAVINRANHNLTETGYAYGEKNCSPGNTYSIYCTDGCGYYVKTKDPCTSDRIPETVVERYLHTEHCTICRGWTKASGCIDSAGKRINCQNLGTCAVCGYTYRNPIHHVSNNGKCEFCGKQFVKLVSSNVTYASDYSFAILEWRLRGVNGGVLTGNAGWYSPTPAQSKVANIIRNGNNDYTYQFKITFSMSSKNEVSANFDTTEMLRINGDVVHFSSWGLSAYYDHVAPTSNSITISGNGTSNNFSRKATITAKVNETFSDTVEMRLLDSDERTVIVNWGAAVEQSNVFTRTFDVIAETRNESTLYVESRDRFGNTCKQSIKIRNLDSKAPVLVSQTGNTTNWTKNKQITYNATDKGIGQVQIGFNSQNDYELATKNGDTYSRTYNFVGDVYGTVTGALYLKDGMGNIRTEKVTISNIDNTAPTITNVKENISQNRKTANLVVEANDINTTLKKSGSGINGYQITRNTTVPTTFQSSNTFNITQNGTYYLWAKDVAGNVSARKQINVVDLEVDVAGSIAWNDSNNKYNSRVGSTLKLYRKISGGQEQLAAQQNITAGQTSYNFQTKQCDSNGNVYEFRVAQEQIPGYETIVNQRNITNNLIVPNYTGELKIEPKDSFQNKYLKNGKVKLEAKIQADSANRAEVGVHTGTIQIQVDNKIDIDKTSIRILVNGEAQTYTINNNGIILPVDRTKAGDKVDIYLEGTLREIGNYNTSVTYTGKLKDYRGENTNINLGTVVQKTRQMAVEYQLPEANIQFSKKDSITGENLTNAEFTIYQWDGEKYTEVEKVIDENKDGIYTSKIYRWNHITQGKYKIVETKIPQYHTNIEFGMEYTINQLRTGNYTITAEYNNEEYKIRYTPREPDNLKRQNGLVENEPWKVKVKIDKIDLETKNIIQNKAEFKIYEWNNEKNIYEISRVTVEQLEDKTYLSSDWIYYTSRNEGKYAIVETKAPFGYYGDYEIVSQKNIHYINIVDWIESEEGENEGTISLGNTQISNLKNETKQFTNTRVKASVLAKLVDSQTKEAAQGDATLEGAVYGLYACEEIYHADGVTTRYEEPGLLYKKDELVQIQASSKNGELVWHNLECGKYYIKMIQAPNGYLLDEKKYKIDLDYETEEKTNINQTGKIHLQVKKQAFELYKINENAQDLANAGFSIYKISELSIVKEGKIVRKTIDRYELKDENAKKDKTLTQKANKDGTYILSDLIDYYYKIQRKEGENEPIPGNEIVYNTYNLKNEALAKDYSNYNADEDGRTQVVKIREIRTNENGYMKSPKLAYGEYIVIETSVPREQNNVPPFIIQITENSDKPQTLKYIVDKNFKTKIKLYVKDARTKETIVNNQSAYVIRNVKTKKLETYTIEVNGKKITYGTKDNPFVIGKDGYIETPMELGVGEYIIEQLVAPKGYVKNGEEAYSENGVIKKNPREQVKVTIRSNEVYHVNPVTGSYVIVAEQINEQAVGNIKITSQGEFLSNAQIKEGTNLEYTTRKIQGSQYELIAKENITTQDGTKTVIYKKGDRVASFTTNGEDGVILENLPQGEYEIKQIAHAQGFADKKIPNEIAIKYENQNVPVVEEKIELEEKRQQVKIVVYNKDSKTGKAVKGGIYGLYVQEEITYINNKGQVKTIPADTLITKTQADTEGKIEISSELNKDIPQGKYYLKELEPAKEYIATLENIEIDATTKTGEAVVLVRKDNIKEKTTIKIKDVDKNGKPLIGGKLEIIDNETVLVRIEKMEEINEIEGLQIGKRYKIRKVPVAGYTTGEEIEFSINEDGKLQIDEKYLDKQETNTIVITSEATKLKIVVQDKQTKEKLEGVELEIKNADGKTLTKLIEREEKGTYYIQKLPIGEYKIIETKIPTENGYVEKKVIKIKVEDNENWQEVVIEQESSKILMKIEDEETKEIVKNAQLVIRKKDTKEIVATTNNPAEGNKIRKIETTDQGYVVTRLPIGEYEIIEKVPDGYKQIGIIEHQIKDTKEWQNIIISNRKLIFSMNINKDVEEIRANTEKLKLPKKKDLYKIEIRNKNVKTDKIEIQYKIEVKNTGEIDGTIGTIIDIVPNGLEYVEKEKGLWQVSGNKVICNKYNDKVLKPGETGEVVITLKWKNSENNFGEKKNTVGLKGSKNKYGYPNKAVSTNVATQIGESSVSVVISLRTGIEYKITAIRIGVIVVGILFVLVVLIVSEVKYLERKK